MLMCVSFNHSFSCETCAYLIISSTLLAAFFWKLPYMFWDAYNALSRGIYAKFPWDAVTSECQDCNDNLPSTGQILTMCVLNLR